MESKPKTPARLFFIDAASTTTLAILFLLAVITQPPIQELIGLTAVLIGVLSIASATIRLTSRTEAVALATIVAVEANMIVDKYGYGEALLFLFIVMASLFLMVSLRNLTREGGGQNEERQPE